MTDVTIQPNEPEARSPTGEILDKSQLPPTTTTTQTGDPQKTPTPEPEKNADGTPKEPEKKPEEKKPEATGAPEKYADFTLPEGATLDAPTIEKASALFKDLNLSQPQAQSLVDFYQGQVKAAADAGAQAYKDMVEGWGAELKADKDIGGKLPAVSASIGKMLDSLGDPALTTAVKDAMNLTGAGNHPAIVKAMAKLADMVNEGTHVQGKGPSPHGQTQTGQTAKPSAAQALYPNN